MNHVRRPTAVALLCLLVAACGETAVAEHDAAATLETSDETGIFRVTLTPKAAERLGVETVAVRSENVVRTRVFGAEVVSRPIGASTASGWWVQINLTESELQGIDTALSGLVFPLDAESDASGLTATAVSSSAQSGSDALLYHVRAGDRMPVGTRVLIELQTAGTERLIVPYSAVVYDSAGQTWTYVNPEPLVFTRYPISIEYVAGDEAFLLDGPSAGAEVVSVGSAELTGIEHGLG